MRKNRAIRAPDLRPPTSQRLNRGPVGSNLYRTEEAFRRLSQSLRPYE